MYLRDCRIRALAAAAVCRSRWAVHSAFLALYSADRINAWPTDEENKQLVAAMAGTPGKEAEVRSVLREVAVRNAERD